MKSLYALLCGLVVIVCTACSGTASTSTPTTSPVPVLPPVGGETVVFDNPPGTTVLWSEAAWRGNRAPSADSDVVIAAGQRLILNQNAAVRNITIYGSLEFAQQDLSLSAASIMVVKGGTFQVGSQIAPFGKKAVITLVGSDPNLDRMGMGTKFLGAMGGTISLHGKPNIRAWTKLAQTALRGDTRIQVLDARGWSVGDEIVLASGSHEPDEAEVATIAAIDGLGIILSAPLRYTHTSKLVKLAGHEFDMRPEVGLLSRNIVIQGDASSSSGFGGHVMVMVGSKAFLDSVEFRNMGQRNRLGRYPFHWHLLGDASGQYIKNSVVNGSLQRGIVVHGTRNVTLENNIVYNSLGHNYMIEDEFTTDNTLIGNLAVSNRVVLFSEPTLKAQNDNQAANFWIRAAKNTFIGNVAAGSHSFGFWYDNTTDAVTNFRQNVGHSVAVRPTKNVDFLRGAGLTVENNSNNGPSNPLEFSDSFFYNNQTGIWPKDGYQRYRHMRLVDQSKHGVVAEGGIFTFTDTLLVGRSSLDAGHTGGAFHIQYSGVYQLERPFFMRYGAVSVLSNTDIFMPWQADVTLSAPSFFETNASEQIFPEIGLVELRDNLLAPKGFYVAQAVLAAPGAQRVNLGQSEQVAYWRTERRYHPAGLSLREGINGAAKAPGFIVRSDGLRYAEASRPAFQILHDAGYTYHLESVPKSEYVLQLEFFEVLPEGTPSVQVTVGAERPPRVYRVGAMLVGGVPPEPPTEADRLSPAASLAEFQANPLRTYYYDAAKKLLYVHVAQEWLIVRP
ncbi:MAG: G8 domain-containing protein [Deinococcales bacterium]